MVDLPGEPIGRTSFEIAEYQAGRAVVLAVAGEVDSLTAPELADAIRPVLAAKPAVLIVDLLKVEFLASAGMTVLVTAQAEVQPPTRFAIVADGSATSRPLKLMGIDTVVPLYRTLDDALSDLADA